MKTMLTWAARLLAGLHIGGVAALYSTAFAAGGEDEKFYAFLDAAFERSLNASPITASAMGNRAGNDKWDQLTDRFWDEQLKEHWRELHWLHELDRSALSVRARFDYDVFESETKLKIERNSWRYHLNPINQIVGLHLQIVGTLVNNHRIENPVDAEAFIARLERVGQPIDQLIDLIERRADMGIFLPEHLIPRLIEGAESALRGAPFDSNADNIILDALNRRLGEAGFDKDRTSALLERAGGALEEKFGPAYRRLIATLERQLENSKGDFGAWYMPDGDGFYRYLLRQYTTTGITPEEIHTLGLGEVSRIHDEMRAIMQQVGFKGELAEFFQHLKTDPRFFHPNTDAGREAYLAAARGLMQDIEARIPQFLPLKPDSALRVRRFEAYREASSPGAFYESGTADGSRPGTIFLNLHDMNNAPIHELDSLMFHEGIPGHHLQQSLLHVLPALPKHRTLEVWWSNAALVEGWALYAEYFAKELGYYKDPYADFGRLAAELWRACRLVVDSGLHYKRWTRQQAIDYLNDNTSSSADANAKAVDRYLAVPGQATAFKIGMMKILELRAAARRQLENAFDIRGFHYAVLRHGTVPLDAVEASVKAWIAEQQVN